MSFEPVARMSIVRQVSSTLTLSAVRATGKCSTVGPSAGSSYTALVMARSPAGAPLPKTLRAVMR